MISGKTQGNDYQLPHTNGATVSDHGREHLSQRQRLLRLRRSDPNFYPERCVACPKISNVNKMLTGQPNSPRPMEESLLAR